MRDDTGEAVETIRWYAMRSKIEVFHTILNSGRRAADAKLRTADPRANLVSVFCVIRRPDSPPTVALTDAEIMLLDRSVGDAGNLTKLSPGLGLRASPTSSSTSRSHGSPHLAI